MDKQAKIEKVLGYHVNKKCIVGIERLKQFIKLSVGNMILEE